MPPALSRVSYELVALHAEVYPPAEDSFALVDAVAADAARLCLLPSPLCLEVGCGSGYVVTSVALLLQSALPTCVATDTNPHAVSATRRTLSQHGVEGAVVLTDLVSGLEQQLAGRVDVLLFNPPYVPSPPEEVGGPRLSAAWAGGLHGRVVIDRFLPRVPALLAPGGTLYMVAVSENGVPDLLHQLASLGLTARVALVRTADCERLHILVARRL